MFPVITNDGCDVRVMVVVWVQHAHPCAIACSGWVVDLNPDFVAAAYSFSGRK